MKGSFKSGMVGFAVGLAVAAAGAQAAVQATQHEHPTPSSQKPAAGMKGMDGMKDMHAMMADPAMRQKMMANMAQCRDMMSMMMEHMKRTSPPRTRINYLLPLSATYVSTMSAFHPKSTLTMGLACGQNALPASSSAFRPVHKTKKEGGRSDSRPHRLFG